MIALQTLASLLVVLGILVFGRNRVSPKTYRLSAFLVFFGAHLSGLWIIIANSWMQTPTGFHIVGEGLKARAEITRFHGQLCEVTVLDPACGSGNFLYVTLEHLKRLEGEILDTLEGFSESQSFEMTGITVDPHQFLGLELNPRAAAIDLVVIRESTEGLFASRGRGTVTEDREARDTMVITRAGSERVHDFAFRLAQRRRRRGRAGRVTCVDKANVFVSMAFFRKVFDERAALLGETSESKAVKSAAADVRQAATGRIANARQQSRRDWMAELRAAGGLGAAAGAGISVDKKGAVDEAMAQWRAQYEGWAALRSLGCSGLADLIGRNCLYARRFAEGLKHAGHEVLNEVVLNQVLVSFGSAERTRQVVGRVQEDGTCWCGGTEWQGHVAMRISVSSWATTEEDVERSLRAIIRLAAA